MKVIRFENLKKNENVISVANCVVFDDKYFVEFDAEIKEGDENKALETALKYTNRLQVEAAKIEAAHGQRIRVKTIKKLSIVQIGAEYRLSVDFRSGADGVSVPQPWDNNGTLIPWRDYKKSLHRVFCAFVDTATLLTVSNINNRVTEADAETEAEAPQVEATEAPKVDNKKAEGRKKAEAQAAARRAKHAEEAKAFEA